MTGRASLLAAVLGSGVVQCLPGMPAAWLLWSLAAAAAAVSAGCLAVCRGRWRWYLLAPFWACLLGFVATVARVESRLADQLDAGNVDKVARVVLRVAGLVRIEPGSRRFQAEVLSSMPEGVPSRIEVAWHAPGRAGPYARRFDAPFPDLVPGQLWRMSLNLRRPHGARNPHGFDYEAHMFAQGLRATGSVRGAPRLVGDEPWAGLGVVAERARHAVRQAMLPHVADKRYGAVLLALAIGDQASVPAEDWQVFNRSGITHLVSISGSHVTMIAALGGLLALWCWPRLSWRGRGLAERMPSRVAACMAALLAAWLYCLLAGWGVPARRTFLMLAVAASGHALRIPVNASRLLCLALLAVVALDPWALLSSGFWLSFGAVGVLMAGARWWRPAPGPEPLPARWRRRLGQACLLQLAITAALTPLLGWWFHQVSLVSPLVNAYAIPFIGMAVTPLALLLAMASLVPGLQAAAGALAWLAHGVLLGVMQPTAWLAGLDAASFDVAAPPWWLMAVALAGVALGMLSRGPALRIGAWLLMAPALAWRPERPPQGAWDLFALDVGQGGAVVVRTASHVFLFDTGLRSGPGSDAGARAIVPFLRGQGLRRLDALIVSHADIDHVGGARSVLAAVPVAQSFSSFDLRAHLRREAGLLGTPGVLPPMPRAMSPCRRGMAWQADGVAFDFLWPDAPEDAAPPSAASRQRNARGCVLRLRGVHHSALLTGDIGAAQEARLVRRGLGRMDLVMAPHHGSKGSSSPAFVRAAVPAHVLAQAGAWNRYGHPNPVVQSRWEAAGAYFWRTDAHGALIARSRAAGLRVDGQRLLQRRYWQGR